MSGTLSGNNLWAFDGSPYILTGNVIVPQGANLAIGPGVDVDLNGWFIRVDGLFRATGSSISKINFTGQRRASDGNYLEFGPTADSWNQETNEGSIVEYSVFRVNTALEDAAVKVVGSAPRMSKIEVMNPRGSGVHLEGPATLEDSRICDNFDRGIIVDASAVIQRNMVCGNRLMGILVRDSSPRIIENVILANNWLNDKTRGGISVEIRRTDGAPVIQRNNITDNLGFGIRVFGERVVGTTTITQNIIEGNQDYQARLGETRADVNMSRNWWGTTNREIIADKIYDEEDEFGLRKIMFLPINTSPPTGVPAIME